MPDHNPRHAGRCSRCNGPVRSQAEPLMRSLEFERGVTRQAAHGAVDPTRLIEHAEQRAGGRLSGEYVGDPMHIATGRDRLREAREELADCRNHLLWWMQQNLEDEDRTFEALQALRFVALAYGRLLED